MNGKGKSRGQLANPGSAEKMAIKMVCKHARARACVCARAHACCVHALCNSR